MSKPQQLVSFDWAIKRLLRNKASFTIFEGFLSELLRDDIKIKSLLESESNRETKDDRSNRVDMLVENKIGELIIVEIQRETEYDYLQRILFGASKLLVEYMKKSMPYSKIRKITELSSTPYCISCQFDSFKEAFRRPEGPYRSPMPWGLEILMVLI